MGLAKELDVLDRLSHGEFCASVTRLVRGYEGTARTKCDNGDSLQQMNKEKFLYPVPTKQWG
jgi:hypothetical protein